MADLKISQLTGATTPLAGTEVLPIVQSGTTKQVSVANLTAGRAVSAASLQLTTTPLPASSGGTGLTSLGTGIATWLGTPSSANLAAAVTDETGSGALVFGTSPTIATPTMTGNTFSAYNATYFSGIRTRQVYIGTIAGSGSSTITGVPTYYRGFIKTDVVVVAYDNAQGALQVGKAELLVAFSNNTMINWGISTPTYNESLGTNDYRSGGYFTITAAQNGNNIDVTITNTDTNQQTAVAVFFTDYISTN